MKSFVYALLLVLAAFPVQAFLTPIGGGGGGGTIGGSTGSTDRAILIANGTGGSTVQASAALVDSSTNISATAYKILGDSSFLFANDHIMTQYGFRIQFGNGADAAMSILGNNTSQSFSNGMIYAQTNKGSNPGIIVQPFLTQTVDLQRWEDTNGNVLSAVGAKGNIKVNNSLDPNTIPLTILANPSQNVNVTEWQDAIGTPSLAVDTTGTLYTPIEATLGNQTYPFSAVFTETLQDSSNIAAFTIFSRVMNDTSNVQSADFDQRTLSDGAGNSVATWSNASTFQIQGNHLKLPTTVTTGGTTGAQTINKPVGCVNFAAAASSLVVTNSLVTTTSPVLCTVNTADATATLKNCAVTSNTITVTLSAAATAETRVCFFVLN